MIKQDFLSLPETIDFSNWLADCIEGREIDFQYSETGSYFTLTDAFTSYHWPSRRFDFQTPAGNRSLAKNSSFYENRAILIELQYGLRKSMEEGQNRDLSDWVEAILRWGGVYTEKKTAIQDRLSHAPKEAKGNKGWLNERRANGDLYIYLKKCYEKLAESDHDDIGKEIPNLRSNAGLTKVYSLALDDFIIYDSRVAAALTWLVSLWSGSAEAVPEFLRFGAMKANTSRAGGKLRSANMQIFPYFQPSGSPQNHLKHLRWNIRANWILQLSLHKSLARKKSNQISTLRELESSLFMMGDNLYWAKRFTS